jgi:hypothetical protein
MALLDLLLALLATLLARPARPRRPSWHYLPAAPHGEATTQDSRDLPRCLRRGSPDIIIALAHAGPRRRARPRPAPKHAPKHAPPTTARAPPHPPHKRKRPRTGGASARPYCYDIKTN